MEIYSTQNEFVSVEMTAIGCGAPQKQMTVAPQSPPWRRGFLTAAPTAAPNFAQNRPF